MGASTSRGSEDDETRRVGPNEPGVDGQDAAVPQGTMIGRYVVIEPLGEGGMGVVLRAYDPKLRREVALKRLRQGAIDATAEARLVREAQAMARLNHPNVVAVYDIESGPEGVFVAMELVLGTTLRERLAERPQPWAELVRTFVAAGHGLAAAHRMGLVHRDFKPTNVLVSDDPRGAPAIGRVKVGDFGLARALTDPASTDAPSPSTARDEGDDRLTQAGLVHGTPRYMAPEQLRDEDVGVHADQYAFCVALWEALCGTPPFHGDSRSLQKAKLAGPPSWPRPRGVPASLGSALRRGLATDPRERWPDMDALLSELGRDPAGRRRTIAAVGVGVAAIAGLFALRWADERQRLAACASSATLSAWNDEIADETAAAIAAHGGEGTLDAWARVRPALDGWATSWHDLHEATCIATTREPEAARPYGDATVACLDEHRDRFGAVIEALGADDREVVASALTSAASLVPVGECADERVLAQRAPLPDDAEQRAAIAEIRLGLTGVDVEIATARYARALQHASELRAAAQAIGWSPLVAEVDLGLGRAHERLGDADAALAAHTAAFYGAAGAGHDLVALRAAIEIIHVVGVDRNEHAEALRWAELAQMLVTRLGLADRRPEADLLVELAMLHRTRGAYADARAAAERALALDEALFGSDHLRTASDVLALGAIELDAGSIDAAHAAFTRGAERYQALQGARHPAYARALELVATAEFARGEYTKALEINAQVLEILGASLGTDHLQVARGEQHRANMLTQLGKYDEALAAYARAEAIVRKQRGDESIELARLYNNVAIAWTRTGRPAEALVKLERALAIREHVLEEGNPEIGRNLHSIGVAYGELGDHGRALAAFERALAIRERALGPRHPEVALTLVGIARVHLLTKHAALGLPFAERALAITREQLGAEHVDVASILILVGDLQFATGDVAGAGASAEQALAIRERGEVTPYDRAEAKFAVGRALRQRGAEPQRARELLTSARDELRELGLPQHMDMAADADQLLKAARRG